MKHSILTFAFLLSSFCCFAQDYTIEGNELKFDRQLTFKSETAILNAEDIKILTVVKNFLNEKSFVSLMRIEGHVATGANMQQLSAQRAEAVARWLAKEGIDCKRLIAVGFGNTKPSSVNNRIVFALAGLKNKLIGGMPADGGGQLAADICKNNTSK